MDAGKLGKIFETLMWVTFVGIIPTFLQDAPQAQAIGFSILIVVGGFRWIVERRPGYEVIPWSAIALCLTIACAAMVALIVRHSTVQNRLVIKPVLAVALIILVPLLCLAVSRSVAERRRPRQVFINYARADKERVKPIYRWLQEAGAVPWMDETDVPPGAKWEYRINNAIWRSHYFIACLSRNSVNREGVLQDEIERALEIWEDKGEDAIFLIPVRLEECEMPERLSQFQWIDLFAPGGPERLQRAVQGRHRAAGTLPPNRLPP
jgi:hypothetical protein